MGEIATIHEEHQYLGKEMERGSSEGVREGATNEAEINQWNRVLETWTRECFFRLHQSCQH